MSVSTEEFKLIPDLRFSIVTNRYSPRYLLDVVLVWALTVLLNLSNFFIFFYSNHWFCYSRKRLNPIGYVLNYLLFDFSSVDRGKVLTEFFAVTLLLGEVFHYAVYGVLVYLVQLLILTVRVVVVNVVTGRKYSEVNNHDLLRYGALYNALGATLFNFLNSFLQSNLTRAIVLILSYVISNLVRTYGFNAVLQVRRFRVNQSSSDSIRGEITERLSTSRRRISQLLGLLFFVVGAIKTYELIDFNVRIIPILRDFTMLIREKLRHPSPDGSSMENLANSFRNLDWLTYSIYFYWIVLASVLTWKLSTYFLYLLERRAVNSIDDVSRIVEVDVVKLLLRTFAYLLLIKIVTVFSISDVLTHLSTGLRITRSSGSYVLTCVDLLIVEVVRFSIILANFLKVLALVVGNAIVYVIFRLVGTNHEGKSPERRKLLTRIFSKGSSTEWSSTYLELANSLEEHGEINCFKYIPLAYRIPVGPFQTPFQNVVSLVDMNWHLTLLLAPVRWMYVRLMISDALRGYFSGEAIVPDYRRVNFGVEDLSNPIQAETIETGNPNNQ